MKKTIIKTAQVFGKLIVPVSAIVFVASITVSLATVFEYGPSHQQAAIIKTASAQ